MTCSRVQQEWKPSEIEAVLYKIFMKFQQHCLLRGSAQQSPPNTHALTLSDST